MKPKPGESQAVDDEGAVGGLEFVRRNREGGGGWGGGRGSDTGR